MLGSNSGVGVALSRGSGSLKVWSMLMRRPSFPQTAAGDRHHHQHHHGRPTLTAASLAHLQDEEEDGDGPSFPETPTTFSLPFTSPRHHPDCLHRTATASTTDPDVDKVTSDSSDGGHSFQLVTCTYTTPSGVTLGGVTSPDGSRTPLLSTTTATTASTMNHLQQQHQKLPRRLRRGKRTVLFNVGGQTFETYRSTLKKLKNSFFADDDKLRAYFRPSQGDYFFDRDPTAFGCVLNYLRTGELHVPTTMCGPALQTELEFWGVEEMSMERCCWTQYNTWKTQSRSLQKLEYDRKFSTTQNVSFFQQRKGAVCWGRVSAAVWQFLQDPSSSRAAKAYAWVSLIFVFVSIFSFCADTHPVFRVRASDVQQFASVYRFFNLEFVELHHHSHHAGNDTTVLNTTSNYNGSAGTRRVEDENQTLKSSFGGGRGGDGSEGGNREGDNDLPHPSLLIMDLCCLVFFTMEYVTRFLCSPGKINFFRSFQNIIDFVAISPDYVELLFLIFDPMNREGNTFMDLMFILRMLRLCRIFRLIRHVPGLWILLYTLKASFNELMLMFIFLLIGMVVFATLMHFAEAKNGFPNIPVGFWWSVVTMTTVGYGDMFPRSAAGYVIGSCCAVAGLLMIAFTVPIIVSNFVLYYTHVQYGLARRDRQEEEEEGQGQGDEENQLGRRNEGKPAGGGERVARSKRAVDCVAVVSGENVALTSPVSSMGDGEGMSVVDEVNVGAMAKDVVSV